jgi:DNA processing protein
VTLGIGRAGPLGPARFAATDLAFAGPPPSAMPAGQPIGEREALAVLVTVDGVGPTTLARLLARIGSAREVLAVARRPGGARALIHASRAEEDGATHLVSLTAPAADLLVAAAFQADRVLARLQAAGITIVTLEDPAYPPRLRSIDLPPHVLFVEGDPEILRRHRVVAVVGTRRPSEAGRRVASRIAAALARTDVCVVSGLAVGIDGSAHAAVVADIEHATASGPEGEDARRPPAPTVAVLGGGHQRLFPSAHRPLARRILSTGGAIVSEFGPDTRPTRGTFPRRNRIVSGLAEATVVVEARPGSGALITAAWALQQGRGCFLVPGRIDDGTASGCLAFLREASGEARIVASVEALLEDLDLAVPVGGLSGKGGGGAPLSTLVELGDTARLTGELLVDGLTTVDELVTASALPVATILAALTILETRGLVVGAYGRYRPAGRLAGVEPARPPVR